MKKAAITLFAIAIFAGNVRAQSVADTLKTLNGKVATLESRPAGTGAGTRNVKLQDNSDGGTILLANSGGRNVLTLETHADGSGQLFIFNKTAADPQISLGIGGNSLTGSFTLFDGTGKKELVHISTSFDGSSGRVDVNGRNVHDYAEVFDVADCRNLTPGSVVAASADGKGIKLSGRAYDPAAVGVLSGAGSFQPGMRIGSREDGASDLPVAVSGQVYVRVSNESGPIKVGDLLVSSSIPGVAMRAADPARLTGTVIGKALQPYSETKESLIRMLVLNR